MKRGHWTPDEDRGCGSPKTARTHRVLATLIALALATTAHAQHVTDGDSIKFGGENIRIHGIDAPEINQTCNNWPAGREATSMLVNLLYRKAIRIEPTTTDRYGRTVARVFANGLDVGSAMVRSGMAYAFVRYARDYTNQEAQARTDNLGVHRHGCLEPWVYRAQQRGR